MWLTDEGFKTNMSLLKDDKIPYIINAAAKRTILIKQSDLLDLVPTADERVWLSAKKQKATPVAELDHQRISNIVGLLELMLKKGRISKIDADNYMVAMNESIIPELNERFNGEILKYKPFYAWEKDLVKLPDVK